MQAMDDMALLREYARRNSEAAFAELVSRRVGFVYAAALRQVRDEHLAAEITQAVFILLAQKAGRIAEKTVLTGWLFRATRFTALAHIRAMAKRQRLAKELQMQSEPSTPAPDPLWEQMLPLLDEALAALGESDQQALLLRFFENKSLAEVGMALGTGEDTARKRTTRALEKLHRYFRRRGISSTTAIIAGALSNNSVQAVPVALAKTVTAVAIAKGAAASTSTLILIKGALKLMAWTKAKTATVAGIIILMATCAATVTIEKLTHKPAKPYLKYFAEVAKKPGGTLTLDAVSFIGRLKNSGLLPGFPKNEPYWSIALELKDYMQDSAGVWHENAMSGDNYPISRTLRGSKNNDGHLVYFYTVTKASKTDSWKLVKAWRTDFNGQILEEYPLP